MEQSRAGWLIPSLSSLFPKGAMIHSKPRLVVFICFYIVGVVYELGNEKRAPGCFGFIGDCLLPSYVGIIS